MSTKLENFERAFSSNSGGCRRTCECGVEFYDYANSYDWEDGELEALQADPKKRGVDYSVGTVEFENREFCVDCKCWHPRAEQIMRFLDSHAGAVAEYLTLEKKRKQHEADISPVVT